MVFSSNFIRTASNDKLGTKFTEETALALIETGK
jgi:hypothetical protein